MYEIGQLVIYGMHGVCSVTGLDHQKSGSREVDYLILEPLNQSGSRFLVPTHNAAAMDRVQKMLTKEELAQLLQLEAESQSCWCEDEGKRKQSYREVINSGDRKRLFAMLHSLYRHKAQQASIGRKVHLCDENFLRDAEKLVLSEISVVMDMESDAAKQYLRSCLQN